jgi:hypothetical protein
MILLNIDASGEIVPRRRSRAVQPRCGVSLVGDA